MTSAPVQQNYMSTDQAQPRVWYQRKQGDTHVLLSGSPYQSEVLFEVEVDGLDPDVAAGIATTIQDRMNGFFGIMGQTRVLGAFVEDAADDYQPRGINTDDGYHVFAFGVRIIT